MLGRVDESRSLFERVLTYAGRLGLFSEEIDSGTNSALGNYASLHACCTHQQCTEPAKS